LIIRGIGKFASTYSEREIEEIEKYVLEGRMDRKVVR